MEKMTKKIGDPTCLGCYVNQRLKWFDEGMKLSGDSVDYSEVFNQAQKLIAKMAEEPGHHLLDDLKSYGQTLKNTLELMDGRLRFCAVQAQHHSQLLRVFLSKELSDGLLYEFRDEDFTGMWKSGSESVFSRISLKRMSPDLPPIQMRIARSVHVIGRTLQPHSAERVDASALSPEESRIEQIVCVVAHFLGLGTRAVKDCLCEMRKSSSEAFTEEEKKEIQLYTAVPERSLPMMRRIRGSIIYALKKERQGYLVNSIQPLRDVLKLIEEVGSLEDISDIKDTVENVLEACTNLKNLNIQLGVDFQGHSFAADWKPVLGFEGIEYCGMLRGSTCPFSLGQNFSRGF